MAEGKTAVHVFSDGAWKVIQPQSDLTGAVSEAFDECLANALSRNEKMIALDFSKVADLDAPAFRALAKLAAAIQVTFPAISVRLVSASYDVAQLFAMTRLDRIFDIDSGEAGE